MLGQHWTNVANGGPLLVQHWFTDLCLQIRELGIQACCSFTHNLQLATSNPSAKELLEIERTGKQIASGPPLHVPAFYAAAGF